MLFNSAAFAVFFPVVVFAYYGLPRGGRVPWLLLSGVIFYGAFVPEYLLILAAIILIDYVAGRGIERLSGRPKLGALIVSIAMNVGVLLSLIHI